MVRAEIDGRWTADEVPLLIVFGLHVRAVLRAVDHGGICLSVRRHADDRFLHALAIVVEIRKIVGADVVAVRIVHPRIHIHGKAVRAHRVELLHHLLLHALHDRNDGHDGGDADEDGENGQRAAALFAGDGFPCHFERL